MNRKLKVILIVVGVIISLIAYLLCFSHMFYGVEIDSTKDNNKIAYVDNSFSVEYEFDVSQVHVVGRARNMTKSQINNVSLWVHVKNSITGVGTWCTFNKINMSGEKDYSFDGYFDLQYILCEIDGYGAKIDEGNAFDISSVSSFIKPSSAHYVSLAVMCISIIATYTLSFLAIRKQYNEISDNKEKIKYIGKITGIIGIPVIVMAALSLCYIFIYGMRDTTGTINLLLFSIFTLMGVAIFVLPKLVSDKIKAEEKLTAEKNEQELQKLKIEVAKNELNNRINKKDIVFCKYCGTKHNPEEKRCSSCGAKLD